MDERIIAPAGLAESAASQLRLEYEAQWTSFAAQTTKVRYFLETEARQLAEAILQGLPQVRFRLPDRVVSESPVIGVAKTAPVPAELREQLAGGLMDRLTRTDLRTALRQRLSELEQSAEPGVATAAALLRHAVVLHLVHNLLPAGRSVVYRAVEGEEIATIPEDDGLRPGSAITESTDAIAGDGQGEAGRGELVVPYVPSARRFYLPQWVAFDEDDHLLVNSIVEAESRLASMQRFLAILHAAVALAPYMVVDQEYQQKRYGMLGQLVNQGRALARYQTNEIVRTIQRRSAARDLNRGFSLSLPYFDDQALEIKTSDFEVIPAGRIMFVPALVVRAARQEQVKVAQDTRLSPPTRRHLLAELRTLEIAFSDPSEI
jgi:hypothetical protein